MPILSLIRIASILSIAFIFAVSPDSNTWRSIVWSMGFGHYFMALWYSRRQITQVVDQPSSYIPLTGLLFTGLVLYLNGLPLVIYFLVHHAFNEVYINRSITTTEGNSGMKGYRVSAIFLHLFIYSFLLRHRVEYDFISDPIILLGLAVCSLIFLYFFNRIRTQMKIQELIDRSAIEFIGIFLVAASFYIQITFLQIVAYHFVFWMLFSIPKIWKQGNLELYRYLGLTFGITGLFLLISPIGIFGYDISIVYFFPQFILWSYIHITISFALSDTHPDWIVSRFRPRTAPSLRHAP